MGCRGVCARACVRVRDCVRACGHPVPQAALVCMCACVRACVWCLFDLRDLTLTTAKGEEGACGAGTQSMTESREIPVGGSSALALGGGDKLFTCGCERVCVCVCVCAWVGGWV